MATEQQNGTMVPAAKKQTGLTKQQVMAEAIASRKGALAAVATKYLDADRLVKLAQAALAKTPLLAECDMSSILVELMACSRLGLEPNEAGGRWLVPFKNSKTGGYDCQGITDYRALIDIARRSGEVTAIHADVVRAGDLWEYWIDSMGPVLVHLKHVPAEEATGDLRGAYAIVRLKSGEVQAIFLNMAKIAEYRGRSRGASSGSSPWNNDFNAMAIKTAIRRLYNLLPKTPEIQAAREELEREEKEEERPIAPGDVAASAAADASAIAGMITKEVHQGEKEKVRAKAKALADQAAAQQQAAEKPAAKPLDDVPGWELTPPGEE